jgi:hypothetical protein
MSTHTPAGASYTTQDLIKMARLEYFGQYSGVVGRALTKLSILESENKNLRERINQLEKLPDPEGKVINSI